MEPAVPNESAGVPTKSGVKRKRPSRAKKATAKAMDGEVASLTTAAANMYRRFKGSLLFAYPTFDKSDSLVFFPSLLIRHTNGGDFTALTNLLSNHLHTSCDINAGPPMLTKVTPSLFVKFMQTMADAYPDGISCVHETKVVDNTILATILFKFTDTPKINDSLAQQSDLDASIRPMFQKQRSERWDTVVSKKLQPKSEEEREEVRAVYDSPKSLVVYGRTDLAITIDDLSNKVTRLKMTSVVTNIVSPPAAAAATDDDSAAAANMTKAEELYKMCQEDYIAQSRTGSCSGSEEGNASAAAASECSENDYDYAGSECTDEGAYDKMHVKIENQGKY